MTDYISLQTNDRSKVERSKLVSLDLENLKAPTAPLFHQESRFLYVLRGSGVIELQNRPYELRSGTLFGILPGQISRVTEVSEPLQFYTLVYNLQVFNKVFCSFSEANGEMLNYIEGVDRNPVLYCNAEQAAWMQDYFLRLQSEVGMESDLEENRQKPLHALGAITMLLLLVIHIIRMQSAMSTELHPREAPRSLSGVFHYMYHHAHERLTLDGLSRTFFVSQSALRSYIKRMTGRTFSDLLNEMRLSKVMSYLLYTNMTLEDISLAVGFWDASHISKVFVSYTGISINEYRKTYRKSDKLFQVSDRQQGYALSEYIIENHREPIKPCQVAEQFGVSVSEMNRLLLIQNSRNFEDYLNFVRIHAASRLLLSTEKTIMEIAIDVGYSNVRTFNRNFFRFHLMTPTDFRKSVNLQPTSLQQFLQQY